MKKKSLIEYTKFYLDNGLKCILYKRDEIHSINIAVKVNVGSLDEDKNSNGISHLLEHLPFDGTERFKTWSEVDAFNNSISGSGNAYTSTSSTRYYGTFPHQYLEEALIYYSQLVFHPLFKESDVNKEREIVLDEMKRSDDAVESKVYDNMRLNRYATKNTSFEYKVIGSKENVSGFKDSEIREHHEKHYTPANMEIYIVGNFDEENLKKLLSKYFDKDLGSRKFGPKLERKFFNEYPDYSDFSINALQKSDVDQYYLSLSFPSFEKLKTPVYKFEGGVPFVERTLASSQYQQSVLWKRLREELGLVYGVNAYTFDFYSRAMFVIETSFRPEHLETILKEVYHGVNNMITDQVTDEVFRARQKRLIDTQLMVLDNPESVIDWIEEQEETEELTGERVTIEDFIEIIKNYRFEDVVDISKEILDWSKLNIGIVSKDDSKAVENKVSEIWQKIAAPIV